MSINWSTLDRLRSVFLEGVARPDDYWRDAADLAVYDATFAQRIGWKWDYVLGELETRGWSPPRTNLLDWGCGSGIATRAFLDWFGHEAVTAVSLWDRSDMAMQYAAARARQKYPSVEVRTGLPQRPDVVLLSHVLTELTTEQTQTLVAWLAKAAAVLWVEPGTFEASRRLIAVREALRGRLNFVAPCTHDSVCGLRTPGNERHWCHHFAPSPPAVYTDAFWGRFAQMTGVDLRSLPLSYLVLDRHPAPGLPAGTVRVLGRPRVYKSHAAILACDAPGVAEWELKRRELPEVFLRLRKRDCPGLQTWERQQGQVTRVGFIGKST
jgi:hypothetical protein